MTKPRVIATVAWLTGVVAVYFVAGFFPTAAEQMNVALGTLAAGYGTWAFLTHGGGRITALGLLNLSFALFVGVGGANQGLNPSPEIDAGWVSLTVSLALLLQMLVNLAAWQRAAPSDGPVPIPPAERARRSTALGAAGIAVVFAAQQTGLPYADSTVADGAVFASVALFAAGLILRDDTRLVSRRVLYALAAFVLYAAVFHQGTGRLRLVALACVIGLLLTARFPHRGIKWTTVAATPVAIYLLAQDRLALQESLQPGASEGRTGLESMMSPIRVFTQILQANDIGIVEPAWGQSFLSVPFIVVPEALQPAWVPPALGYDLVGLVDPAREGSGYSVVSTVYGEWYWNFGWLGLILAVPVLAWLVGAVDSRFRRALGDLADHRQGLVRVVFWAMLAGGIADLVWSGTHTWVVRHLTRLPVLLALAALFWLTDRPSKPLAPLYGRDPRLLPAILRERLTE